MSIGMVGIRPWSGEQESALAMCICLITRPVLRFSQSCYASLAWLTIGTGPWARDRALCGMGAGGQAMRDCHPYNDDARAIPLPASCPQRARPDGGGMSIAPRTFILLFCRVQAGAL